MKLFINTRFLTQPISGVQRYGIECSLQIKRLMPEAVFLAPPNILHHDIARELNVQIIGKNTGHKWEQLDLLRYMNRHNKAPLLNLANMAPLFYKYNYVTIHDLAFFHHPEWNSPKFSAWYNFMVPRIARRSQCIFTVSETIKKEITSYYRIPAEKIAVTYNGISSELQTLRNISNPVKEKIILSVGTFTLRKNQQMLVRGFLNSSLRATHRLVLIGDRNKVFAESGIDDNELTRNNIEVLQHVTCEELAAIYARAEIVASLSEYEGFGIPMLEGLFFGCKIVASEIPVYRELFNDTALFCAPRDEQSIAAALETAAHNTPYPDPAKVSTLLEKYNYSNSARTILEKISSLHPIK